MIFFPYDCSYCLIYTIIFHTFGACTAFLVWAPALKLCSIGFEWLTFWNGWKIKLKKTCNSFIGLGIKKLISKFLNYWFTAFGHNCIKKHTNQELKEKFIVDRVKLSTLSEVSRLSVRDLQWPYLHNKLITLLVQFNSLLQRSGYPK